MKQEIEIIEQIKKGCEETMDTGYEEDEGQYVCGERYYCESCNAKLKSRIECNLNWVNEDIRWFEEHFPVNVFVDPLMNAVKKRVVELSSFKEYLIKASSADDSLVSLHSTKEGKDLGMELK